MALALHGSPALGRSESASARAIYEAAHAREAVLRHDLDTSNSGRPSTGMLERMRSVVGEYDRMARGFPHGVYRDKALLQGAVLSADAYWTFGEDHDREVALRLFGTLRTRFPTSALNRQADSHVRRLEAAAPPARTIARASTPATRAPATDASPSVLLTSIRRESLSDALRLTLELSREATFHDERLEGPPRVFVDLKNTRVTAGLKDARFSYDDDVVRQIRVGRPVGDTTRVVVDLQGAARHSVYSLYNPYRIVIDIERAPATKIAKADSATRDTKVTKLAATQDTKITKLPPLLLARRVLAGDGLSRGPVVSASRSKDTPGAMWTLDPLPAKPVTVAALPLPSAMAPVSPAAMPPVAPSTNLKGGFSLSRQLGLGISRVVVDAGHGGHDPGARVQGLNEADLVLDVALRLEKLLKAQPGVEVILTRRSNVYVPLEQRTAIANRDSADLFLSIHANASENPKARGLETYFLNFAPNIEAEKLAARENSGAAKTMHALPEIVKAIALNNKIDESRDFASLVQSSMYERLQRTNRETKDLGVKQAPFMVLIGATMPSVLAEISFITNDDEARLLKTTSYRQQIAESLLNGIMRYQRALKATRIIAAQ